MVTADQIKEVYIAQNLSQRVASRKLGISQTHLRYLIGKYNISKNVRQKPTTLINKRVCTKCNIEQEADQFYFQNYNSGRKCRNGSWCKACMKNQVLARQRKYKQLAIDYKGGSCLNCKFDKCQAALEFHHLDPLQKDFEMSKFSRHPLTLVAKQELDKCVLLCANCHRMVHAGLLSI